MSMIFWFLITTRYLSTKDIVNLHTSGHAIFCGNGGREHSTLNTRASEYNSFVMSADVLHNLHICSFYLNKSIYLCNKWFLLYIYT